MKITILILSAFLFFGTVAVVTSCDRQNNKADESNARYNIAIHIGDTVSALGKDIDCIFQDKADNYWFASNGDGVYCYNGKTLLHITDKDGLCSNFVWTVQEDVNGHLWFSTRDGVCSFNGTTFTNYTDTIQNAPAGKLHYTKGGLFFNSLNAVCFYNGKSFTNFFIHPNTYSQPPADMNRPYDVYSTLVDKDGNVWFGTQSKGVCRYNGETFSYLTDKDLAGPAVRSIFQDKAGNLWFGNNGGGLFRYDGKTLTNITEEKGLSNPGFLRGDKFTDKPGTLARVWAINEDKEGNIWIGTIDAGLWVYDGTRLTNYTTKDGLTGNAIWTIYKDKKGELWFVTNGDAIWKLNGKSFTKVAFGKS
ncbi:hypothetical protein C7N43_13175 [Sphingobacteriales bacterium UPWRP_1]|nr:hypothetical protein BVG80_14685 [Sphingobacteriales bacterium TSM_CSM]PSJ76557.1 hypothetical protein C7N43_13175 [Sphingobacteriales bacterium UPWRP_1]